MKATILVAGALLLSMLDPTSAVAKVKQKGLNGLGAVWGSVGVTSVSSNEKLCPQYLFRTDDLEYHIRPKDTKHPIILPIGHEAEFKIKKDEILLKVADGDHKTFAYHVISMEPIKAADSGDYRQPAADPAAQSPANSSANQPAPPAPAVRPQDTLPQRAVNQTTPPPTNQPAPPPQY